MDNWRIVGDVYDINNQEASQHELEGFATLNEEQPSTSGTNVEQESRQMESDEMGPGPSTEQYRPRNHVMLRLPENQRLLMKRYCRRPTTLYRNMLRQQGRSNPQLRTFMSESSHRNEQPYPNDGIVESPRQNADSPTMGLLHFIDLEQIENLRQLRHPEVDRAPVVLEDIEVDQAAQNPVIEVEETPQSLESVPEDESEAASARKPEELNKNLLTLLECPVCFENMEPPICQCRRGHLLCYRCRGRLNTCPVCRSGLSSVRNRAMERVAEIILYPCRHGCAREMHLRHRRPHEESCTHRKHSCPMPRCSHNPMHRHALKEHLQAHHEVRLGAKHKFSMKMNKDQHCNWAVVVFQELFHVRVDLQLRAWNLTIYVTYIGPKKNASKYRYDVALSGNSERKMYYMRSTHSDVENFQFNVSRKDCFCLCLDDATNFLREPTGKYNINNLLTFHLSISENDSTQANQPPVIPV